MRRRILPQLFKEQYILGELEGLAPSAEEAAEWEREIATSNSDIFSAYPPEKMIPEIMNKVQHIHRFARFRAMNKIPAAIAAVLVFIIALPVLFDKPQFVESTVSEGTENGIRTKGSEGFRLYLENDGYYKPLSDGDAVSSNDVIQIALDKNKGKYGILFSLDGNGVVTLHFPSDIATSVKEPTSMSLPDTRNGLLPYGYRFDNAPRFERFFLVVSDSLPNIDGILSSAEDLVDSKSGGVYESLKLSDGYEVSDILLFKE